MKSLFILLLLTVFSVNLNKADDLLVGNSSSATLVYLENVKLTSFPFTTREKNVFYSSERNQIIRAIRAIDLNGSKGKATVTSGGTGFTFANVKIKSSRGDGLNYQVQIFV